MTTEPISGYDIKASLSTVQIHFWNAKLAQIYPALKKLEQDGLLKSKTEKSSKGPSRKTYQRTKKGTKSLTNWLLSSPELGVARLPYLSQIFFLNDLHDHQKSLVIFNDLLLKLEQQLLIIEKIENQWREETKNYPDSLPDDEFYKQLTVESGRMVYQTRIEWCRFCIKKISNRINTQ